jgi:hypothetical protein
MKQGVRRRAIEITYRHINNFRANVGLDGFGRNSSEELIGARW